MIGMAIMTTAGILIVVAVSLGMLSDDTGDDFWLWHIFFGSGFLLILGVWLAAFGL